MAVTAIVTGYTGNSINRDGALVVNGWYLTTPPQPFRLECSSAGSKNTIKAAILAVVRNSAVWYGTTVSVGEILYTDFTLE